MPLYEYECEACHHQLEAQQKIAEAPLKTCPSCGKDQLQRLISATSFTLKGGGWYKDLYSSAKPGSESKSTTSTPSSSAKGSGDKGGGGSGSSSSGSGSSGSSGSSSGGSGTSSASAA